MNLHEELNKLKQEVDNLFSDYKELLAAIDHPLYTKYMSMFVLGGREFIRYKKLPNMSSELKQAWVKEVHAKLCEAEKTHRDLLEKGYEGR